MLEDSINNNVDPTPLLTKSIEKDIDAAKTHLTNHVTIDDCEFCQIYFRE